MYIVDGVLEVSTYHGKDFCDVLYQDIQFDFSR